MLGIKTVMATLPVTDLEQARKFYEETLGLTELEESPGGITYQCQNSLLFVYPSEYAGTNKATAASWTVRDVNETVTDLKSTGVTFEQYDDLPGTKRDGDVHTMDGMQAAWFKDPAGNILNVVSFD
jgi:catechol 2,3-dioxygenase-like lactoylglutathione lyase family enzyme